MYQQLHTGELSDGNLTPTLADPCLQLHEICKEPRNQVSTSGANGELDVSDGNLSRAHHKMWILRAVPGF